MEVFVVVFFETFALLVLGSFYIIQSKQIKHLVEHNKLLSQSDYRKENTIYELQNKLGLEIRERENAKWLAEENAKDKYCLHINTASGKVIKTPVFEPNPDVSNRWTSEKLTSLEQAERAADTFVKGENYIYGSLYVPGKEITAIKVKKVESNGN